MRSVTMGRPASSAPVQTVMRLHTDGAVTIDRRAHRPATSIRCVGCVHFLSHEEHVGYRRYSCDLGHLRTDRGSLRWFTDAEVSKPSGLLSAVSRACQDRTLAGDSLL